MHVIQAAAEKQVNVVLVHIGAYISIIPVAQNRNIIEKHIRSLKPKLVEPAVFGNNKLQLSGRHIVVSFHSKDIVGGKTRHGYGSFL